MIRAFMMKSVISPVRRMWCRAIGQAVQGFEFDGTSTHSA